MQTCKNCQSTLPNNARVCPFCGSPVQKNADDARRRLLMRLRIGTLPSPLAATAVVTPYLIASTLVLGFVMVGLFLRPPVIKPTQAMSSTLIVTPLTLDFGMIEVGKKAVKSVVIKTSSVSHLKWALVSGNPQWLSITKSNETKEPDNLSEVIYDVTANTSKLHVGQYSVTYDIDAGGVTNQQLQINIQVIPPSIKPLPAKLNVNPPMLDFGTQIVGSQMTQLLTVSNSGQMDLNWMADRGNMTWFTLDTTRGSIAPGAPPQVIKVVVNTTPLTARTYSAVINFTSTGGIASVDVKLNVVVKPTTKSPQVLGVSPSSGLNDGGTTVVITGTGFTGASMVSFGSVQVAASGFTVKSDTQITIVSPPANRNDLNSTVDVTVTTPIGTSAINPVDHFTYYAPTIPVVTKVGPKVGSTAGGTSVTITGTGFIGATKVLFGVNAAISFIVVSDTQITSVSPPGGHYTMDCTCVHVTVATQNGTSLPNAEDLFTYIPKPVVLSINPMTGPSSGGTSITIIGAGFTGATAVSFGTVSVANNDFTVNSDTEIMAISPAGSGIVDVTITVPWGTSLPNAEDLFTYIPKPVVLSINPITGPSSGGTSVTITGLNFTGVTGVSFSGTAATNFAFISDTQIIAVSPAGSGNVDVTVTTPSGTSDTSLDDQFTYIPPPYVKFIMPIEGPVAGGTTVAIFGSNFTNTMSVSFGNTLATSFTFISDAQITAVSPAGSANNTVPVIVTTPGGSSVTNNDDQFTYLPLPTVTSINPTSEGSTSGGNKVTINGMGFTHVTSVSFGGTAVAVTNITFISDTQLSVISPAVISCNTVDVTVTTPGGTSVTSPADHYTYCPGPG